MKKMYLVLLPLLIGLQTSLAKEDELTRLTKALKALALPLGSQEQLTSLKQPVSTIWTKIANALTKSETYSYPDHDEKIHCFINDCAANAYRNAYIPEHKKGDGLCRIATYNVHFWTEPEFEDVDESKKYVNSFDAILKVIENIHADILILQEVNWDKPNFGDFPTNAEIIERFKKLGYIDHIFCKSSVVDNAPFGNVVFSKYRFEKKHSGTYDVLVKETGSNRSYVYGSLLLSSKNTISIWGTHLDVSDATGTARRKQIEILDKKIIEAKNTKNILIAGDFNEVRKQDYDYAVSGRNVWDMLVVDNRSLDGELTPPTAVAEYLEAKGFIDCFSLAKIAGPTFTVWSGKVIDFIYLKNGDKDLKVVGCYVYYNAASDHLPVIMDIKAEPLNAKSTDLSENQINDIFKKLKTALYKGEVATFNNTDVKVETSVPFDGTAVTQSLNHMRSCTLKPSLDPDTNESLDSDDVINNFNKPRDTITPQVLTEFIETVTKRAERLAIKFQEYLVNPHEKFGVNKEDEAHLYAIASHALANEIAQQKEYYVFYHAHAARFRIIFDTCQQLYKWGFFDKDQPLALRTLDPKPQGFFENFLQTYARSEEIAKLEGPNGIDEAKEVKLLILSLNLSLFGNMNCFGDSSMMLGFTGISFDTADLEERKRSTETILGNVLQGVGINKKFATKLAQLGDEYFGSDKEKNGYLLQFFIKKAQVDSVVYLSNDGGRPFNSKVPGLTGAWDDKFHYMKQISPFLNKFIDKSEKNESKNLEKALNSFDDLDQKGDEDHPTNSCPSQGIRSLDQVQARLWLLAPELHDPKIVTIKRYNFNKKDIDSAAYYKKLNEIFEDIIKDIIKQKDSFNFSPVVFKDLGEKIKEIQ